MAEWYEGLDAETLAHATTKGWNVPDAAVAAAAAVKAHFGAEKLIGHPADQVLKLPKDAADPAFQGVYDRIFSMVAAKTPEDYKFDGIDIPEDDQKRVRDLAVKHKLPPAVALDFAADLSARTRGAAETATAAAETTKAANVAHLRAAYGADHDFKLFGAQRAVEAAGLPASILAHIMTLPQEEYRKGMDALVALGQKMNEVPMHRGTGTPLVDPTLGLTPDAARERLKTYTTDAGLRAKFTAGDTETIANWTKLTGIVAAANVGR